MDGNFDCSSLMIDVNGVITSTRSFRGEALPLFAIPALAVSGVEAVDMAEMGDGGLVVWGECGDVGEMRVVWVWEVGW